jgi:phospholipid/cholesterol/gamma-HCH transport system substrate-binding protein
VGIVTLVCLAVLVLGYAWLRDWFDSRKFDTCTVWFENANGIEPGDNVTVNGVQVGRVKKLAVADGGVTVTFAAHYEEPLRAAPRLC